MGRAEQIAQLIPPTEQDIKEQNMIRHWRLQALKANTEALGRDYCASLINLSEIEGQSPMEELRKSVALNGNPARKNTSEPDLHLVNGMTSEGEIYY